MHLKVDGSPKTGISEIWKYFSAISATNMRDLAWIGRILFCQVIQWWYVAPEWHKCVSRKRGGRGRVYHRIASCTIRWRADKEAQERSS